MAKKPKTPQLIDCRPKAVPWRAFEEEVAVFAEKQVRSGDWGVNRHSAKVQRKPRYYSKDRESDIIFDVSIEVFLKGDQSKPLFVWIIECKDYPDRSVKVDEIEEFHSKLTQVGAHKGIVCTRVGFEQGARTFAQTHGISLLTLEKEESWVIQLSRSGGCWKIEQIAVRFWQSEDGIEREPTQFDYVLKEGLQPFEIMVLPVLP